MTSEPLPSVDRLPQVLGGIDLADAAGFAGGVPHELFARLRRAAPVLFHPCGPGRTGGFWVLTRYVDIAAAAADPALSAVGGGGRRGGGTHLEDLPTGAVLFMMDDPRHALIKRTLRPSFIRPLPLVAHATELVDRAVSTGVVDVVSAVAEPFALHVVCELLGIPERDRPRLARHVRTVVGFTDRRTGRADSRSRATFAAIRRYFQGFISNKRGRPAADLGSVLAMGEVPGDRPLSTNERELHATVSFVSGFEQLRNTIASALVAFAEHPDQWRVLREDRSLLASAVEEVLRWAPPNPYNRRTATRDLVVGGEHIRAGDKVTFWWPSANRDAEVFTSPEVFDVRRAPNRHLAFGAGTHLCSGAELSRAHLRLVLARLLDRVERINLVGPVVLAPNNKHTVLLNVPATFVTGITGR